MRRQDQKHITTPLGLLGQVQYLITDNGQLFAFYGGHHGAAPSGYQDVFSLQEPHIPIMQL